MKRAHNFQDLTGQKFGRLTVVRFDCRKNDSTWFICKCDCGNEKSVIAATLKAGSVKSCGCYHDEFHYVPKKHGMTGTSEYNIWLGIKQRCLNPSNTAYPNYGGRGIRICDRWAESFENFHQDMGKKPSDEYTIERIDNDGPYSPENCKWADKTEQANNRSNGVIITYQGKTQTLAQWAKELGIKYGTLWHRIVIAKMPIEKVMQENDGRYSNSHKLTQNHF